MKCTICNREVPCTNYGVDQSGNAVCYSCCADQDRQYMIDHGQVDLYLTRDNKALGTSRYIIGNWPGSLQFFTYQSSKGSHNIAGSRIDVWFNGPDGHVWHGVQYGEWTQVLHCKRTKQLSHN